MKGKKLTPAGLRASCRLLKFELKDAKDALEDGFRMVKRAKAKAARLRRQARDNLLHHGETVFFEWEGGLDTARLVDWLTQIENAEGSYGMCAAAGVRKP